MLQVDTLSKPLIMAINFRWIWHEMGHISDPKFVLLF